MKRLLVVLGIMLLSVSASAEPPKDTVTIPLDQIWAFNMPGTRSLRELEPQILLEQLQSKSPEEQNRLIRDSIGDRIVESLADSPFYPKKGQQAGAAFVVAGSGIDALNGANDILAHRSKRQTDFSARDDLNIIFDAYVMQAKIHLMSVERKGNSFLLQYGFSLSLEDLFDKSARPNLAIIPVGELPVGTYDVAVEWNPQNKDSFMRKCKITKFDSILRLICRGFTFHVGPN